MIGTQDVSWWTSALEITLSIDALSVARAWTRDLKTLVLVDALVRVLVVSVAPVALTLETSWSVYATTMGTHCWHQSALVDFLGVIRYGVHYLSWDHATENFVVACEENEVANDQNSLFSTTFHANFNDFVVFTYDCVPMDTFRKDCPRLHPSSSNRAFSFVDAS